MKDNAPADMLGYVTVSLPEAGHWQGFYVLPAAQKQGEKMLREVEGAVRLPGSGEVSNVLAGTEERDQQVIGALSSVLVQLVQAGTAKPEPRGAQAHAILTSVAGAAWALHKATGHRWLLVTGKRDPEGRPGFVTTVRNYEVGTLDEAREQMSADIDRSKRARAMMDEFVGGLMDLQRRKGTR